MTSTRDQRFTGYNKVVQVLDEDVVPRLWVAGDEGDREALAYLAWEGPTFDVVLFSAPVTPELLASLEDGSTTLLGALSGPEVSVYRVHHADGLYEPHPGGAGALMLPAPGVRLRS